MKNVSLVLGGGAARGYAHIGVINVLEKHGYKIKSISGTSIGSLIGGLYSVGALDAYIDWVNNLSKLDMVRLLDFVVGYSGIIKGEKIFAVLKDMIGDINIENLPIKYTAVATDITSKREVWFQKGDLLSAIRASVSIPSVFTPVEKNGHYFVDGGILNLLPISPVTSDMNDLIIAVDLNADISNNYKINLTSDEINRQTGLKTRFFELWKKSKNPLKNNKEGIFDIANISIVMMQNLITRYKIAEYKPDIIINISRSSCELYDFHKSKEMIEIGKIAAEDTICKFENSNN